MFQPRPQFSRVAFQIAAASCQSLRSSCRAAVLAERLARTCGEAASQKVAIPKIKSKTIARAISPSCGIARQKRPPCHCNEPRVCGETWRTISWRRCCLHDFLTRKRFLHAILHTRYERTVFRDGAVVDHPGLSGGNAQNAKKKCSTTTAIRVEWALVLTTISKRLLNRPRERLNRPGRPAMHSVRRMRQIGDELVESKSRNPTAAQIVCSRKDRWNERTRSLAF